MSGFRMVTVICLNLTNLMRQIKIFSFDYIQCPVFRILQLRDVSGIQMVKSRVNFKWPSIQMVGTTDA